MNIFLRSNYIQLLEITEYKESYKDFLYDYSLYPNINDLFLVTDILITDYSSVPFEFCLLNKPMIFFAYDLKKYVKKRGIIGDFIADVPGPVVYNSAEIIETVRNYSFDSNKLKQFNARWNQYSDGNSSKKLVNCLFDQKEVEL